MGIPTGATWVRFPRFVGDAAMQLPVLRLMRQIEVGPLVVWGPAATVELVREHPLADAVLPEIDKPSPWAMAATLRQHRAARSIHFPKSLRPALAAWLARVPERIGVDESLAGLFNTHSGAFWSAEGPFLERYHRALARRWPELPPMPHADYDPGLAVEVPDRPFLALMPGSMWPSKSWPAAHFRQLALRAKQEGWAVVVLGSRAEGALCAEVAEGIGLDLSGRTGLREAAAWLRAAKAVVGNDSGLSHLAAATGTQVLALYGATDPGGSAPWGPRAAVLKLGAPACSPCFKRECPVEGHPCLSGLMPERVWDALQGLLRA